MFEFEAKNDERIGQVEATGFSLDLSVRRLLDWQCGR